MDRFGALVGVLTILCVNCRRDVHPALPDPLLQASVVEPHPQTYMVTVRKLGSGSVDYSFSFDPNRQRDPKEHFRGVSASCPDLDKFFRAPGSGLARYRVHLDGRCEKIVLATTSLTPENY